MNDTINQVGAGAPAAWTRTKPTAPGAYWIRGEGEGMLARTALVEVVNFEGELWCNLHMRNTDPEFGYGYTVAQLDEAFEWLGPLSPAAPVVQAEPVAVAITEKQVMSAYFSASRLHISGTSNWVAAFAQSLNKQIAAPPAQPDASVLVEALKDLLPDLDEALEDLELFGLGSDQGYRKLKDWYRKMLAATKAIDAAMAAKEGRP